MHQWTSSYGKKDSKILIYHSLTFFLCPNELYGLGQVECNKCGLWALDLFWTQIGMDQGTCRLLHYVQNDITVALGCVHGLSTEEEECYRIIVDEVLKFDVQLQDGEKTFWDLTVFLLIGKIVFREEGQKPLGRGEEKIQHKRLVKEKL